MKTTSNDVFNKLIEEYELPRDLSFKIDLPKEILDILNDEIQITELGIALKSNNNLRKPSHEWENQSIIEYDENHFHVDWYAKSGTSKEAFMLGIKTITLLAQKFTDQEIKGIQSIYSFQTPELGKRFSKENNFHTDGDSYLMSDRLSFHKIRNGEKVMAPSVDFKFEAILIIEI